MTVKTEKNCDDRNSRGKSPKGSNVVTANVIDVYLLLNLTVKPGNCGMKCLTREPMHQVNLKRDDLS